MWNYVGINENILINLIEFIIKSTYIIILYLWLYLLQYLRVGWVFKVRYSAQPSLFLSRTFWMNTFLCRRAYVNVNAILKVFFHKEYLTGIYISQQYPVTPTIASKVSSCVKRGKEEKYSILSFLRFKLKLVFVYWTLVVMFC